MSPSRILAASSALITVLWLAAPARGQDGHATSAPLDSVIPKAEFDLQKENLRGRNRASMHPGNPLDIVGIEQGDNEIRSRTPALAGAERTKVIIDEDAAYKKKLALYGGGGLAMQPVTIERQTPRAPHVTVKSEPTVVEEMPPEKRRLLAYAVGLLTSALLFGFGLKRYGSLFGRTGT